MTALPKIIETSEDKIFREGVEEGIRDMEAGRFAAWEEVKKNIRNVLKEAEKSGRK